MSELSDEDIARYADWRFHTPKLTGVVAMAKELQRRRASALPVAGDVERMREALRQHCITTQTRWTGKPDQHCGVCGHHWLQSEAESHARGCLAALSVAPSGGGRDQL